MSQKSIDRPSAHQKTVSKTNDGKVKHKKMNKCLNSDEKAIGERALAGRQRRCRTCTRITGKTSDRTSECVLYADAVYSLCPIRSTPYAVVVNKNTAISPQVATMYRQYIGRPVSRNRTDTHAPHTRVTADSRANGEPSLTIIFYPFDVHTVEHIRKTKHTHTMMAKQEHRIERVLVFERGYRAPDVNHSILNFVHSLSLYLSDSISMCPSRPMHGQIFSN